MPKAIVTGGAGFIGSHVVELLLKENYQVVCLDNMSNGQLDNVEIFKDNPNYSFYQVDLSNTAPPMKLAKWGGVGGGTDLTTTPHSKSLNWESLFANTDYVFHLAALADIVPSIEEPLKYYEANVTGTINVLEASRKYNIKKFIYSASSSCYGIPDNYPTAENDVIAPQYPYALTKKLGEDLVLHWHKVYKLPIISLRYFNVFGTRARTNGTYGAVFKVFLKQKLAGKPLTIVGDGTQVRDFIYVSDVAQANLIAANSNINGEIFNVGTGKPQSINYLAELIGGDKIYLPDRPGEPKATHADISKIQNMLNWRPTISFEEGVKIMLDNIDYWQDAPLWDENSIKEATKAWFKYL
jgi:UDP-glucose 4-epimerase